MCKTHETPSNATQAPAQAAEWAKQRFNKTATPGEADFSKLVDDGDLLGIPSLGAAGGSPKQDAPARSIIARASFIALSHFPAAFRRKKAVQRASIQLGALTARLRELVSLDKLDAEEQAVCTAAVAILQVRRRVCTAAGRAQGMVVLMRVTGSHGLPACGGCTVGTHSRGEGGGAAPGWRALRRAPAGGHGSSCRPSSNSGSAPPPPPLRGHPTQAALEGVTQGSDGASVKAFLWVSGPRATHPHHSDRCSPDDRVGRVAYNFVGCQVRGHV